jgi:hypothetical protein
VITVSLRSLTASLLILLLPAASLAQITTQVEVPTEAEEEEPVGPQFLRLGVSVFGTAGTFQMDSFNRTLTQDLTAVARDEWGAPEIRLDPIDSGVGYGAGVSALVAGRVTFAVDYERLLGTSDVGGRLGSSDIRAPANAITATLGYALYKGHSVLAGVAAGVGRYESDASAEFVVQQELVEKVRINGDALGQHYLFFVDSPVQGHWRLLVQLGYRHADISDLSLDVEVPETPAPVGDEPPAEPELVFPIPVEGESLNWSGFMGRASLVFAFGL